MMKMIMEKEKKTEIKAAIEELSLLSKPHHHRRIPATSDHQGAPATADSDKPGDHSPSLQEISDIPMRPFLDLCQIILQVLDKIGPTMGVLRQDMFQNIQRLELRVESDPTKYINLTEILKKEAAEGSAKKSDSCSRALLWLTRSLDFTAVLLEKIAKDPSQSMEKMVEESYNLTLKPWHGWISSAAYKVALKLLPDNKTFIELLAYKGQNVDALQEDIKYFITLLVPLLNDIHFVLGMHGLDRLKCT